MTDDLEPAPLLPLPSAEPPQPSAPPDDAAHTVFLGPNGLRAGWRLLIAFLIFYESVKVINLAVRVALRHSSPGAGVLDGFTPTSVLVAEITAFIGYLLVAGCMSRIEGRRRRDYGLAWTGAFGGGFWLGAIVGFVAITLLLAELKLAGVYAFGSVSLDAATAWKFAAGWGIAFLFVGLQEEATSRGYLLFTLTTGIGFWPAAIATSLMFGALHLENRGESIVGALSAGGIGFFFCILIRKTGTLWPAIGFHAAWDWGESYFYGVPDSGLVTPGHLFTATISGPTWITGGSVGPEGSAFCLGMIVVLCVATTLFFPDAKFPNPEAIPDPRRRRVEPAAISLPRLQGDA